MGLKFNRQSPIGRYTVDFVCKERNLIIEIDGGHHQEQESIECPTKAGQNGQTRVDSA